MPQSLLSITPDNAEHDPDLALPTAQVSVLSGVRTFWEKATLIHVECHRPSLRPSAERLSRHWYDLARLAAQMFYGDSLSFETIVERLRRLEAEINA